MPTGAAPASGNDFLLYIDINSIGTGADPATPVNASVRNYKLIAGQRTASPSDSLGTADATTKDSNNTEESIPTNTSAELAVDGVRSEGDEGQEAMKLALKYRNIAYFKRITPEGIATEARYIVTKYSEEAPQDDVVTYSATLKRTGAETVLA